MKPKDELRAVHQVEARLATRFPSAPAAEITEVVGSIHHDFDGAPIRDYIPVLVEHAARSRLAQLPSAADGN